MSGPTRTASRRTGAGFTLVEILVALLILSVMAALGYGTYRAARLSAERTEASLKRSREIEFGMRIMVQDLAETVPRPVRDILGESRLPALQGTSGVGTLSTTSELGPRRQFEHEFRQPELQKPELQLGLGLGSGLAGSSSTSVAPIVDLTRAGWSNTAGQQRGTLQRVSYGLVNDVLKRSYQVNLDTVQGNKPVVQDLFTGVKAIQLRYLDGNQTWQSQWPPPGTASERWPVDAAGGCRDHHRVQGLGTRPPPRGDRRMNALYQMATGSRSTPSTGCAKRMDGCAKRTTNSAAWRSSSRSSWWRSRPFWPPS